MFLYNFGNLNYYYLHIATLQFCLWKGQRQKTHGTGAVYTVGSSWHFILIGQERTSHSRRERLNLGLWELGSKDRGKVRVVVILGWLEAERSERERHERGTMRLPRERASLVSNWPSFCPCKGWAELWGQDFPVHSLVQPELAWVVFGFWTESPRTRTHLSLTFCICKMGQHLPSQLHETKYSGEK